jgi:hypothetical protein
MTSRIRNVIALTVSGLLAASAALADSSVELKGKIQSVSHATGKVVVDGKAVYVSRAELGAVGFSNPALEIAEGLAGREGVDGAIAGSLGTGIAGSLGTGIAGSLGTGIAGSLGTGIAGSLGTGIAGSLGTGIAGSLGTGIAGSLGTGIAGSLGTGR